MSEPVQNIWSYQTRGFISSLVITSDGNSIIAGSDDRCVYCFNRNGSLRWWHEVAGTVYSLTLAEGRQRILAGCGSGIAYLWDYNGKLLHEYKTDGSDIWVAAITPDARAVALGTLDGSVFFYEEETRLWTRELKGAVRCLSIKEDGTYIAVGSDDYSIYLFNRRGNLLWDYKTDNKVWAGAKIVAGRYVAAGSNDHHLYLLDLQGNLLWKRDTGSFVHVVAAPPDGRCIAAAGASGTVSLFSTSGEALWSYKTGGEIYALAISFDSRFIVVGSNDCHVYLLDEKGSCIWQQNTQREVFSLAITPDGQLFASGSRNYILHLFKNAATMSNNFMPWTTRAIIRDVRSAYTRNPHLGIATWLDKFDQALSQKDFVSCQFLLAEIRQQGYQFIASEQPFIDTREAALMLCRGIHHHYLHEYDKARDDYEASARLHRAQRHPDGAGQAMLALAELRKQPSEPDKELLDQLLSEPNVRGDSNLLMALRLETLPQAEQVLVIQAANQLKRYAPLQTGLKAEEAMVQATTATAMNWFLQPGPDLEMLLDTMLPSPNWLVRWQALYILQQQAEENADSFTQARERIHQALTELLEGTESDPTVLRRAALLLLQLKDPADTPLLLRLLIDSNPDVRSVAAEVLEVIGDRRAVFVLQQVADGRDFTGNSISNAARSAIQAIQRRLPASTVSEVALCHELIDQQRPAQAMLLFLAQEPPRYCTITIAKPVSGVHVTCSLYRHKTRIFQQELVLSDIQQEEDEEDLVELVAPSLERDEQKSEEKEQEEFSHLHFSLPSTEETWLPGEYFVEIALNTMIEVQRSFKIAEHATLKRAVTCLAYNSAGEPADETTAFTTGETIHCSVFLENAPIGLEIQAQLYSTPQAEVETPQSVKTRAEGRQTVTFSWETLTQLLGTYTIEITMAETQINYVIQVLPDETALLEAQDANKFWLEQAESSLDTNHYGKALTAFERVLRFDSTSVPAWIGKGKSLYGLGRFEEALAACDSALRFDAQSALAYTEKGLLFSALYQYEEALKALEQAIHLDSSFLRAYVGKGLVLVESDGDFKTVMKEALTLFDRNRQSSARTYNYQGIALYYLDLLEEALEAYKQASSLNPLGTFYSNQGIIYENLGCYEEALAAYEQAIQIDPHFSRPYRGKGDLLIYFNRPEEALAAYEQSARLNPARVSLFTDKSKALMLLGRFDEAQQALNAAEALNTRK